MRIISGTHKGRRLTAPKNLPVRPTSDFAKEALFNILNTRYYFDEIAVLDLFAGTGNISYEFGSRGTSAIQAVDSDRRCIQYINKTAALLSLPIRTQISDVLQYLENRSARFHVVFADPPYHYDKNELEKIVEAVFKNDVLTGTGCLIIEHSKHTDLSDVKNFSEARNYGGSVFSFFNSEEEEEEEEKKNKKMQVCKPDSVVKKI